MPSAFSDRRGVCGNATFSAIHRGKTGVCICRWAKCVGDVECCVGRDGRESFLLLATIQWRSDPSRCHEPSYVFWLCSMWCKPSARWNEAISLQSLQVCPVLFERTPKEALEVSQNDVHGGVSIAMYFGSVWVTLYCCYRHWSCHSFNQLINQCSLESSICLQFIFCLYISTLFGYLSI